MNNSDKENVLNKSVINYFPGHMKKALGKIEEKLKLVDFVIILLDSRIPFSSINQDLIRLVKNKPKLFLLTKKDLSDDIESKKWMDYLSTNSDDMTLLVDLKNRREINNILKAIDLFSNSKKEKYAKKGIKNIVTRGMILGIPNVGKSTLINLLNNKNVVISKNMPGVTKNVNWIKISKNLELMDTPGILLPRYEDKKVAISLALIGTIKEETLPIEEVFTYLIDFIKERYFYLFKLRYNLDISKDTNNNEILEIIGQKRGFILKGGIIDLDKTMSLILQEFRNGKIGKMTIERVEDVNFR